MSGKKAGDNPVAAGIECLFCLQARRRIGLTGAKATAPLVATSWPCGRALGASRGPLVAVPGLAGPAVVTKTFILFVGSAAHP